MIIFFFTLEVIRQFIENNFSEILSVRDEGRNLYLLEYCLGQTRVFVF